MKRNSRTTLMRLIAITAVLSMLPLGMAGAQAPEPPPPAAPFESVDMPETGEAPAFGLMTPPVGDSFMAGADRLTEMQYTDGSWGWPLIAPPTFPNILGPIAMGLERAAGHTGDPAHHAALELAGSYLLTKTNNFSPSDGYLALALDQSLGSTDYTTHVNTYFYGPLATGDYYRAYAPVGPYDTEGYVNLIRTSRAGDYANLAAWDLGMGLVGAIYSGVDGDDKDAWIEGVKAEVNELDADGYYDVIGLAGAVYGLAEADQHDFDPTAGEHVLAGNLMQLGVILAGYQLPSGGWTWNANYQVPDDGNEAVQETAYAILALNRLNWENFLPNMIWGADYLYGVQLGTGGWENYVASGENNEVTGEALWALATAYRGNEIWVCESGDCGHPEMSFNNIQDAVNAAEWEGVIHVLPGTYVESVTIGKNVHLIGAGSVNSIIQAPATLPPSSDPGSAILIINGGDNVEITGFTITGPGPTGCGSIRYGIFVRDGAHANIHDNTITDIRDDALPLSGCQNGIAIGVGNKLAFDTTGVADIVNNTIVDYQKGAIVVDNGGSFAHIEGNTITGIGTTDITAQNGIQVSRDADATIAGGNTVTGNSYYDALDPTWSWGAAGILLYQPGAVAFTGVSNVSGNDMNLYNDGASPIFLDGLVLGGSSAPAGIGMDIWNDGTAAIDATAATFTGAVTCADIEDRVYHAMDDPTLGLVTWADAVCVTPDSGSIQAAIDASSPGGTILVYPGTYDETASNRTIMEGTPAEQGPHQFGLFFPITKPGLSVIGVDAAGVPITDADSLSLPYVTTNATNTFGYSGIWVEGAGVTIQGLEIGPNAPSDNKTIEVVGDAFTLRYSRTNMPDGGSVYLNDWLYSGGVSTVESFTVDQNNFDDGTQVAISSGVGVSGDVSGRLITNNSFNFDPLMNVDWPGISFNGIVPAVGWFVHPVGGAVITGNDFSGGASYIRSRGTVEEADFDWTSYWNDNTYDKKVIAVLSATPPLQPRAYEYGDFTNVRIIGALIQPEVEHAIAGDTVLVSAGTFPESVTIDEPITLVGAGITQSIIDATSLGTALACGNVIDITALTGDTTIDGFDILTGVYNSGIHFSGGTDPAGSIAIQDNHIIGTNSSLCSANSYQYGVIGGYMDVRSVTVSGNEISDTYDNSVLMELQLGATDISANTFNGGFPSVFYMTYDGEDVTPLQKVSDNTFDMSLAAYGSGAAGVGVNPSTYYVDASRRNGKYADFEISGNTFTGIETESIKAISVGENSLDGATGAFGNLQIFANTISGTGGKGIQFFGHVTNAAVYNNEITGLFQGLKMFSYESAFWPEGNDISCNQVTGASDKLVYWDGTGTLTAEYNWWGAVLGPNPSLMSANVDYKPWLTSTDCGGGTYPPYPTEVTVSSVSPEPSHRGDSVTIDVTVASTVLGAPVPVGTVDVGYPGLNPIPACNDLALDGSGMASCSYIFPNGSSYLLTATFTPTDLGEFDADSGAVYHKVFAPASDFEDDDKTEVAKFYASTGIMSWLDEIGGTTWTDVDMGMDVAEYVGRSDFDGDGFTDPAKFVDASDSIWYLESSSASWQGMYMGGDTYDLLTGSDFDGDGMTDFAKYVPAAGAIWYYSPGTDSWSGTFIGFDPSPVMPGSDYDGDGKTDMAKYVPSAGAIWYLESSTGLWNGVYIGSDGDPVYGSDFDGDGKTDMAKYLASANALWYRRSSDNVWVGLYLGPGTFSYVTAGDFDGDNMTDPAKFVPSANAQWIYLSSISDWVGQYMGGGTFEVVN